MKLTDSIRAVKGIGQKAEQSFQKLAIYTVGDILLRFPREYAKFPEPVDIQEAVCGEKQAVILHVESLPVVRQARRMPITTCSGHDGSAQMEFIWFRMPYIKSMLQKGNTYILFGKVQQKDGRLSMEQPVVYPPEQYLMLAGTLQPVYALTSGLTNNLYKKTLSRIMQEPVYLKEYLPDEIRIRNQLAEYNYAVFSMHFPENMEALTNARRRLVFDEFFLFVLSMQLQKQQGQKIENIYQFEKTESLAPLLAKLPYKLTDAQMRVLGEVTADLHGKYIMQRLIQGDVGSGKTILAFLTMFLVSKSGYQSAIMAPTEVLAAQHFETFTGYCRLFGLDIPLILLTGSMTAKQKRDAYERMQLYSNAMVIGTHTLIQERAVFEGLALVVTDEQHRFGVRQRETFSMKGQSPHILVMSATPIPRTLAIILYGDLDISVVDEVPQKRKPIKNCVVGTSFRQKAYDFIQKEVELGHQAYVICPLVEAVENMEGENVVDYSTKLVSLFPPSITVGVLHGKMKPADKNRIMEMFAKNEIQVLVSTTVVEVGVNVPNATVMMIEDAQRFGLAQLHQLRGRVGRGDAQSFCIMLNTSNANEAGKRLEILNRSNDGFQIASQDLKLRGPGDFFGIRQSGDMQFQLADIYQDAKLLQLASEEAQVLLEKDAALKQPAHLALKEKLDAYFSEEKRLNL